MTEMFGKEYIVKVTNDGECVTMQELVRCRNCEYWDEGECFCYDSIPLTKPSGFCDRATRKDHETD